jgi:hypothetical protein
MHPSDLNLNEELKIKCRLSAGSAQRRRDQPLMPLATAGIGSATGNRNAQKVTGLWQAYEALRMQEQRIN